MKRISFLPLTVAFSALLLFLAIESCSKNTSNNPMPVTGTTLYDSLGGTTLVSDPTHSGAMIEKGRLAIRNVAPYLSLLPIQG